MTRLTLWKIEYNDVGTAHVITDDDTAAAVRAFIEDYQKKSDLIQGRGFHGFGSPDIKSVVKMSRVETGETAGGLIVSKEARVELRKNE